MTAKANNIKIKPSSKKGESKVLISLKGELTIYTVEGIKDKLIESVNKYKQIEIKGADIQSMDLAFVQLIEAIQKKVNKDKKMLSLDFELNDETQLLFDNTNITRILKNNNI